MVQEKTEMTMDQNEFLEKYNRNTHRIGRITTCMVLVMLIGAPFLIGAYLGSEPDLGAAGRSFRSAWCGPYPVLSNFWSIPRCLEPVEVISPLSREI